MSAVDETRRAIVKRLGELRRRYQGLTEQDRPPILAKINQVQATLEAYDSFSPRRQPSMPEPFERYSIVVNGVEVTVLAEFEQSVGRKTYEFLALGHPGVRIWVGLKSAPAQTLASFRPLRREPVALQASNCLAAFVERCGAERLGTLLEARA